MGVQWMQIPSPHEKSPGRDIQFALAFRAESCLIRRHVHLVLLLQSTLHRDCAAASVFILGYLFLIIEGDARTKIAQRLRACACNSTSRLLRNIVYSGVLVPFSLADISL